ncbi:hypothetical protein QTH90_12905 [Variovorax sp. J2P1-59]|uniref:hypothetical protein n=1 Tax=Variovorax flavidus TaxID=3053501 RepID=UPI002578C3FB|nr:hypothetical protein [Variovorax sp. J2P1-59]MDM0075291.1 hypothetical protein [Variovorax sp. J2P1-59]
MTAGALPNVDDEWPATQRMAYHADAASERLFDPFVPALAVAGSADGMGLPRPRKAPPPPYPSSPLPPRSVRRSASKRSSRSSRTADKPPSLARRLGIWSVLIAVVLLVAMGWGYVYNSRNSAVPPMAKESPVQAPVEPAAPPPVVQMAEPVQIAPAVPPVAEPPVEPVKPVAAAAPKSRKPAPAVATAAPAPVAPAPEPVPAPAPEPVAIASPQSLCAGLSFFARAQCMVTQCAKADYKSHAQCEAVRRQQQIDEEKRNPSLLN